MKRSLLFFMLATLFAGGGKLSASELNIYASGLRLHGATAAEQVTGENQVHIDYFLNAPATDLQFLVLDASTGEQLTSVTIPAGTSNANYTKGSHSNVVVDLSGFYGNNQTYKWAIKAMAGANASFTKVFEHGTTLKRLFATIDNSPESDYMGRIYMENRVANGDGKAYIINSDLTDNSNGLYGMTKLQSASRPSVDAEGYVWWADYGDSHGGLWVMNPATLTTTAFFNGTQASSGIWKNSSSVEMGSSSSGCHVYASGSSTKVYMVNEDAGSSLPANGFVVFNVGQSNGSILRSWNVAPSQKVTVSDNTGGNFSIVGTSHGAFLCQNRGNGLNASGARSLMFYDNSGTRQYCSDKDAYPGAAEYINGSLGGGMAVSKDETKLIMVNGTGNILLFDISWSGDVPTLTYNTTYTTPNAISGIGSLNFDYAGNILATGGTWDSSMKLYIFATPKSDNSCTTPAASSRTIVLGSYIPPVDVTGVSLDQDSKTLVKGQSFTLTATVAPSNATNKNITWTSTDPTVASVSNGEVTALKKGTTTIRVTTEDGSFTDECAVTVELMHGTYNIGGASANYTSLSAAATAIRNIGIDGDVVLLVCADIAENANIGLVNNTDYSITIRPNAATKRTITFGSQADNAGPSGHIMIGYDLTGWAASTAKNIYIDGSYNDEGQYLEFHAGTKGGIVACFYGHVTNSYIKNCRIINERATTTTQYNYGVVFRVEQLAGGTPSDANKTDNSPENVGIESCYISVPNTNVNSSGVFYNGTNAKTAKTGGPTNCYVRNCEIEAKQRCIRFDGANGATIEGTTFRMQNAPAGYLAQAILGSNLTGTINVKCNKFLKFTTSNAASPNGVQVITASGGATGWNIENNYFAGIDATNATSNVSKLVYVRCGDNCVIRHNTFYMPSLTQKPTTAMTSTNPIACVYLAAGTNTVKNNIFVSAETEANNSLIRGTINSTYVNNNIYFHNGGNAAIMAGGSVFKTWDEFTTKDENSKWASPVFSNAATGDLGIIEANADLMVARLNEVPKDLFGNNRNDPTYAGACEPVGVTDITGVPATLMLEEIFDTHAFTATVEPANTTFPTITWSSDNESVATVSAAGVVTAQGAGTATVTATAGGFSVNCLVTVNAAHSLSGTYRIGGANPDFASLHAACEQINTYGLKDNTTLLICADLTESQNSCLVNTSDYTITIRPDADVDRTISFTQASDNVGPSGAFVIGLSNLAAFTAIPTKNIVIDGLASDEATHRMTIKTPSTYGSLAGPIIFYGHVTNSSIKNCIVINEMVHTTKNIYGITFRNEKNTDNAPEGVLVENNLVIVTAGNYGHCINFNGQEASTKYAGAPKNNIVRNNELQASTRAIFLYGANGATIEGNTIKVNYAYSGVINHGVMGLAQTGIITVRNNKFLELKTANTANENGIRAITATGGASKWIIENNYFGGLEATENVASKNVLLEYIYCDDLCEIRHNTFYMPSLSHSPATALNSATPVSCVQLKSSAAHIVKNNIFVSEETTAHNSLISGTLNDNILSNVFYHHGGNAALTSSGSVIGDLDASNKWMPVAFTETYKLDFESANNSLIDVTPISGITTDIEGRTRTNPTHAGCYEPSRGLVLNEEAANNDAIDDKDGQTMDVLLKRHFLVEDGMYTLVLPFDLDDAQLQEAFGAGYKLSVMQQAYYKSADVLYLKFGFVDHLEAGVPCLLQVGTDVTEDILFRDVTIDNAEPIIAFEDVVEMRGLYDMTEVPAAVTNYYLGSGDYLFQYKTDIQTKAFRSFFHFPGFVTSAPPRAARVVFHEEVATDEPMLEGTPATNQPEKIIRDGEMLIIVDGIEYDMMGRPRVR